MDHAEEEPPSPRTQEFLDNLANYERDRISGNLHKYNPPNFNVVDHNISEPSNPKTYRNSPPFIPLSHSENPNPNLNICIPQSSHHQNLPNPQISTPFPIIVPHTQLPQHLHFQSQNANLGLDPHIQNPISSSYPHIPHSKTSSPHPIATQHHQLPHHSFLQSPIAHIQSQSSSVSGPCQDQMFHFHTQLPSLDQVVHFEKLQSLDLFQHVSPSHSPKLPSSDPSPYDQTLISPPSEAGSAVPMDGLTSDLKLAWNFDDTRRSFDERCLDFVKFGTQLLARIPPPERILQSRCMEFDLNTVWEKNKELLSLFKDGNK